MFQAVDADKSVGAIVCKLDTHRKVRRGYIAMLAVDENYRKQHIGIVDLFGPNQSILSNSRFTGRFFFFLGSNLVLNAIEAMVNDGADEVSYRVALNLLFLV